MVRIERLIETGAVRGPYRRPSFFQRLLARLEPVPEPEDWPLVAVVLRDPSAEVEDVIGFLDTEAALEWLEGCNELWNGGHIALWAFKGKGMKLRA
ncbi:hypothetical protein KAR29_04885 [Aminithiophilus ramosus]|uniref:Uncharacterized protein n=1 Tax=Aminithiophilus ramosus TaxID=3029084 RepID=A0A9Q7APQ3_9BACT|nr:hypothetical protein [Aminithiophilus ramosus]QTX33232.1 hypothetical protein KAR29_04885 [Aminithiophilus ramosus]